MAILGNVKADTQITNEDFFIEADGSVSMTGNLDFGGNRITGLGDPQNPQDAATQAYVDSVVEGLDVKDSVLVATNGTNINLTSPSIAKIDSQTFNRASRVLAKDQTTLSENGIYTVDDLSRTIQDLTYNLPTGSDRNVGITYTDPGTTGSSLTISTTTGQDKDHHTVDVNLATDGSGNITSTANEIKTAIDGDATASNWLDVTVSGTGTATQSSTGENFLQATGFTRATDYDEDAEVTDGSFTFVELGATNANSGWVQTQEAVTVGTSDITFSQFSGAGSITAGAGLTKSGNTIDVIAADNSLTVNADDIAVNIDTVNQTLEVDSSNGLRLASVTAGQVPLGQGTSTATAFVSLSGDISSVTAGGNVTVNTSNLVESSTSGVRLVQGAANELITGQGTSSDPVYQAVSGDLSLDASGSNADFTVQTHNGTITSDTNGIRVGNSTAGDLLIGKGAGTETAFTALGGDVSSLAADGTLTVNTSGLLESTVGGDGVGVRLEQGTAGDLILAQGTASDPTYQTMSGDATINSSGELSLANDVVKNADFIVEQGKDTATGAPDGTTTTWQISNDFVSGKLVVALNGVIAEAGNHYTVDAANDQITFSQAPDSDEYIHFIYLKN